MGSPSVCQELRCNGLTLELSRAVVVFGGVQPLLSQTVLGIRRGLGWGSGCWKHSGHQRVTACASPLMAQEKWFMGQPWGSVETSKEERGFCSAS